MSVRIKFILKSVQDEAKTRETGSPVWEDVECISIRTDEKSEMSMLADDWFEKKDRQIQAANSMEDRERLEQEVERARRAREKWQQGREDEIDGRPLDTWGRMTPAIKMTLNHHNIFSVEDLAEAKDSIVSRIHNGVRLRNEAKQLIDNEPDQMATQLAELQAQVEALMADNAELKAAQKPKTARKAA